MQSQATSVKDWPPKPCQYGGHQPVGQPLQADGMIAGGGPVVVAAPATVTPCGSPGWTSWSGPTVDGGTDDGTFAFGVMSDGSYGGRIDRLNTETQSRAVLPSVKTGRARTSTRGRRPRDQGTRTKTGLLGDSTWPRPGLPWSVNPAAGGGTSTKEFS